MDDGGVVRKLPPWLWDIVKPALIAMIVALLVSLGAPRMPSPLEVQGVTHFSGVYSSDDVEAVDDLIAGDDVTVGSDVTVGNDVTAGDLVSLDDIIAYDDLEVGDDFTVSDVISVNLNHELLGIPCVATASVTYTDKSGLFTISDGEIWIVHDVLVKVTTNYDCTGDNCTFQIGDGNDANGLVDLVDAEIQAADTEGTGFAAGWQGQLATTKGAYLTDGYFVYAPSGADETIDFDVGGTSPSGGAATVWLIYTRVD